MSKDYITTNELKKIAIDAGFEVSDKNSKVSFFENGDHRATVYKTEKCSFWIVAEWSNAETMVPLTSAILNYIKTPVSRRSPNVYKLKVKAPGYISFISTNTRQRQTLRRPKPTVLKEFLRLES